MVFVGGFLSKGGERKFVRRVEHRTFSGREAWHRGQQVLYVTERCVFRLHERGLELVEIAPGVELERDILAQMDFEPVVERPPAAMDAAIFVDAPMGWRARLLMVPLAERFTYERAQRTMYVDFEHLTIRTADDVEAVQREIERHLEPLGERVDAVVNYDHFVLDAQVEDDWAAMVRKIVDRHYRKVVRYSTSGFLRAKLGPALAARGVLPRLYESASEVERPVDAQSDSQRSTQQEDQSVAHGHGV